LTSVFNLEVFARHEFFVGEAGVRAHNGYSGAGGLVRGRENIASFESLNAAREAARDYAGINAHVAALAREGKLPNLVKEVSTVGPSRGMVIGSKTADGLRGWRIDWDPTKGFHVNWWDYSAGVGHRRNWLYGANIVRGGTEADYLALLQHFQ
jgi:hypothetical protein